jgi:hypothetical protein
MMLGANGEGTLVFPDAQVEGSVVSCYTSDSPTGPWYIVASELIAFGIICDMENSGSDMLVTMSGGFPYWYFLATLIKEGS